MSRQRVTLVENGVVNGWCIRAPTAKKMKNSEYAGKVGPIEAPRPWLSAAERNG